MENDISKVKRKLWSFGFACKEVTKVPRLDYDLLVENLYQVKVVPKGAPLDLFPTRLVIATVDGDDIRYQICKRGLCREETSPLKAFPKVEKKN